jgi:hypothetical protein
MNTVPPPASLRTPCKKVTHIHALGGGFAEGMLERAHLSGSKDRNYNYSAALFGQGAAEIVQMMPILGALPKLTERGIIQPEDFPLMRHLHAVIAKDEPLNMPWDTFFRM